MKHPRFLDAIAFFGFRILIGLKRKRTSPKIDSTNKDKESVSELIKAFATQFAENQNHHQRLFIQFLSSVLIVLVGFAFVYSNTAGPKGMHVLLNDPEAIDTITHVDTVPKFNPMIVPHQVETLVKTEGGAVITFSIYNLIGIYLFAQLVFLVLSTMILHIGYSFRRDQSVMYNIRSDVFGSKKYLQYFGEKAFQSYNKGFMDFQPNFNSILFSAIVLIQLVLFGSIFVFLDSFNMDNVPIYKQGKFTVSYQELKASLFFPILINVFLYTFYYNKYEKNVNCRDVYLPLARVTKFPKWQLWLFTFLLLPITAAQVFFLIKSKMILAFVPLFFLLVIIFPLCVQPIVLFYFKRRLRKLNHASKATLSSKEIIEIRYYLRILQSVAYIILGAALATYASYLYYSSYNYPLAIDRRWWYIPITCALIFFFAPWILKGVRTRFTGTIAHYFQKHTRFIMILMYLTMLTFFFRLQWMDCVITVFFGIYSFVVGRRTFIRTRYGEYDGF